MNALSEEILINITPREVRVALLANSILQEIHIERHVQQGLVGYIYKGRVTRLLPGLQAAFIDIGLERTAFLHASDIEGYDKLAKEPKKSIENEGVLYIDIRDLLYVGQDILVQVCKDPLGSKGARLTTHFTIPSRYLVLTPQCKQIAVSQKILDETERQRLMNLTTSSEYGGYIFRTAAEHISQADCDMDRDFLNALWQKVQSNSLQAKVGDVVYEEMPIVLRLIRDMAGYDIQRIRVDQEKVAQTIVTFAKRYVPYLAERIEYYSANRPIFDLYGVEEEIQKALQPKVYLKSGGYLVFDQTEAMTTIDVNSGSNLGQQDMAQVIIRINLEAAEAIARQVRLRNIGGIIIIDFIDMEDVAQKNALIAAFSRVLAKDSVTTEISELSSLGLIQMTRKRTRESLEHILCVACPTCHGRGSIKSLTTVAYDIFRGLKRSAELFTTTGFLVLASQVVVEYLVDKESEMLAELQASLGKQIKLQAELSYSQDQYDILPL